MGKTIETHRSFPSSSFQSREAGASPSSFPSSSPYRYTQMRRCRHTRREAGIQCHGWRAQIRPCILDSGNPCRNDGLRDTCV
ncbi:MAG: hypothetical protein LUQ52_04840 [Methylococcaceae bacterium]|nr:hypothetical protein [Methylococcaceae bacterium]